MELTAQNVDSVFKDCLFRDSELEGSSMPENFVEAQGVTIHVGFHPDRLQSHKEDIISMLSDLPSTFHESTGGGWSFLNACMDKNKNQWGENQSIDQLLTLGLAIGKIKFGLPRDMWESLPGGMPYFTVLK